MLFGINAIIIVFGLLYALSGTLMPYHWDFVGVTEIQVEALSPELMILAELSIMLIGFLFLSNGITNLFIWYIGIREGKRWAWLASLAGALIVIPLMYVILIVAGLNFPFQVGFTSLILWISAMLMTAKECISPKK